MKTHSPKPTETDYAEALALQANGAGEGFQDAIELLFFAYRDFIADSDAILDAQGFGRAHHRVLHFVGRNPGLSIAELLDILNITKQSLARVLRDLIDTNYIIQESDRDDRRRRLLFLTPQGEAFHRDLIAPQIARFHAVLKNVGLNKLEVWKSVTQHIINEEHRARVAEIIRGKRRL